MLASTCLCLTITDKVFEMLLSKHALGVKQLPGILHGKDKNLQQYTFARANAPIILILGACSSRDA